MEEKEKWEGRKARTGKILPDFLCCVDVRRAIRRRWIGTQKGDDADKLYDDRDTVNNRSRASSKEQNKEEKQTHNRLDSVDRQPPLRCTLVSVLVLTRGVKDGNAERAIGVN